MYASLHSQICKDARNCHIITILKQELSSNCPTQGEDGVKIYPFQRYPLYHTAYDTIQLAYMMDPDFAISRTVAAVMGELARNLVDSLIIPLSARDYADDICGMVQEALSDSTEKLNKVNSSACKCR